MEIYTLKIDKKAQKEIENIYKSGNKTDVKNLFQLFIELIKNPRFGTGKPERLKHYQGEIWSRQINKKDRIIYEIIDFQVIVYVFSVLGHYKDK